MALVVWLFPKSSYSADEPPIVLIHTPPGWTTPTEGYFLDVKTMSDMTAAIKTYRLERDAWQDAYQELSEKSEKFGIDMRKSLSDLRGQLEEERAAWKAELSRARSPGFGVFAGAGYTGSAVEVVVGVGAVWKLF
jgi:hypothetical protein